MASIIFLHPRNSLSKSACRVKPRYRGWPRHPTAWGTKVRGADGTGPVNALAGPFFQSEVGSLAYSPHLCLPSWIGGRRATEIPRQTVLQRENVPAPPQDSRGCSLPAGQGLAWFCLQKEGGLGSIVARQRSPAPRHGSELSCKLLKDGTALPSALDSLEG